MFSNNDIVCSKEEYLTEIVSQKLHIHPEQINPMYLLQVVSNLVALLKAEDLRSMLLQISIISAKLLEIEGDVV